MVASMRASNNTPFYNECGRLHTADRAPTETLPAACHTPPPERCRLRIATVGTQPLQAPPPKGEATKARTSKANFVSQLETVNNMTRCLVSLGDLRTLNFTADEPMAGIGCHGCPGCGAWTQAGHLARTGGLSCLPSRFAHRPGEKRASAPLGNCTSSPTPEE